MPARWPWWAINRLCDFGGSLTLAFGLSMNNESSVRNSRRSLCSSDDPQIPATSSPALVSARATGAFLQSHLLKNRLLETWVQRRPKRAGTPILFIGVTHRNESDPFTSWHRSQEGLRSGQRPPAFSQKPCDGGRGWEGAEEPDILWLRLISKYQMGQLPESLWAGKVCRGGGEAGLVGPAERGAGVRAGLSRVPICL